MLSSSKAPGLTARSLHQCCRAQCGHGMNRVPHGENMDLCLQATLTQHSAPGTATLEQPKINLACIAGETSCHGCNGNIASDLA